MNKVVCIGTVNPYWWHGRVNKLARECRVHWAVNVLNHQSEFCKLSCNVLTLGIVPLTGNYVLATGNTTYGDLIA